MASKNKSYVQKALDKLFSAYESKLFNFQNVEISEVEVLRKRALNAIKGNEGEYIGQVENRINDIINKIQSKEEKEIAKIEKAAEENFGTVEVNVLGNISKGKTKLQRDSKSYTIGKAVGIIAAVTTIGSVILVSCNSTQDADKLESQGVQTIIETPIQEPVIDEPTITVETISEKQQEAEEIVNEFVSHTSDNTIVALNALLENGVKLVEFDSLTEEQQKELIASMGLQYYVVANIDDITTLEYANFMKEQPNAVLDNDDLIYNFRNFNVLLKQQMLVSTTDNKIDFANIYQNDFDAKLLNEGANLIAQLNNASTSKERKELSKEIYNYIQNTILNSTSELKYSNSAMATFINVEFSAWKELTKNSGYKYGYYPDDELEAKLMTVVSNCGMSKGEKENLKLQDETKTSLESINVIRILNTLDERKENILTLTAIEGLYYIEGASYGDLKQAIIPNIDLTKYHQIQSYTEKKEAEIKSTPKQIHTNDSGVSNGQGGTIANSELEKFGINPDSPTAKQEYEQKVEESFDGEVVIKNEQGEVIDQGQAAAWAQQGAIDANNNFRNNNVPELYQDAYNNGWNAANEAKNQADQKENSSTTFVPELGGATTETIIEETHEDFKQSTVTVPNNPSDGESETTFVPITDGETTEIVIDETVEGFVPQANAQRTIEVKSITRDEQLKELYSLRKDLSNAVLEAVQNANSLFVELEENSRKK